MQSHQGTVGRVIEVCSVDGVSTFSSGAPVLHTSMLGTQINQCSEFILIELCNSSKTETSPGSYSMTVKLIASVRFFGKVY